MLRSGVQLQSRVSSPWKENYVHEEDRLSPSEPIIAKKKNHKKKSSDKVERVSKITKKKKSKNANEGDDGARKVVRGRRRLQAVSLGTPISESTRIQNVNKKESSKSPEMPSRRSTFDIPPEQSFLHSAIKNTGRILDTSVLKELSSPKRSPNNDNIPKQLFRVDLTNEKQKIKYKITDSMSSMTESDISSASQLLRRAQKLTPLTPNLMVNSPKVKLNVSSLKKTLKRSPSSQKRVKSTSKVRQVPNYEAIHKNALDKLESIDVYIKRKADRAKALLSGQKVQVGAITRHVDVKDTVTKKSLKFGPSGDASSHLKKSVAFNITTPQKASGKTHAKTPKPTKEQIWNAYECKIPKPLNKDKCCAPVKLMSKSVTEKRQKILHEVSSLKTKSSSSVLSSVESRRNHIRGVRSNRRFDLLMNMRQNL